MYPMNKVPYRDKHAFIRAEPKLAMQTDENGTCLFETVAYKGECSSCLKKADTKTAVLPPSNVWTSGTSRDVCATCQPMFENLGYRIL